MFELKPPHLLSWPKLLKPGSVTTKPLEPHSLFLSLADSVLCESWLALRFFVRLHVAE